MDEEKALEQLDTLLDEISKIDAPSRKIEEKPSLSNIDILEQFVSQNSSINESTARSFSFQFFSFRNRRNYFIFSHSIIFLTFVRYSSTFCCLTSPDTKADKEKEINTEKLREIQISDVSNEIKQQNSLENVEPLTSCSSEEKSSPRDKQTTKKDETMNKSSQPKETQKPSQTVSSKSTSDTHKGQTTLHQRSQTMKLSLSPSSSTATKPTKGIREQQKKPHSSSKSSAHLSRKTMLSSSSSSSQLPKQISQSVKSQTLTSSKIKYEGRVTEKSLRSSQPVQEISTSFLFLRYITKFHLIQRTQFSEDILM
jgi:hypothetical protein